MMGERSGSQGRFFYRFDLEKRVSGDHLLRKIDAVLDLSKLRSQLVPHYSHTERPSIDPELMIRMLLIGYPPHPESRQSRDNATRRATPSCSKKLATLRHSRARAIASAPGSRSDVSWIPLGMTASFPCPDVRDGRRYGSG